MGLGRWPALESHEGTSPRARLRREVRGQETRAPEAQQRAIASHMLPDRAILGRADRTVFATVAWP